MVDAVGLKVQRTRQVSEWVSERGGTWLAACLVVVLFPRLGGVTGCVTNGVKSGNCFQTLKFLASLSACCISLKHSETRWSSNKTFLKLAPASSEIVPVSRILYARAGMRDSNMEAADTCTRRAL